MILNLSDISDEPLQHQIIRQIRAQILSGELPPNSPLPSIRKLAGKENISVITVQRAYESLLNENLICVRRGKGFYTMHISSDEKEKRAENRLTVNLEQIYKISLSEGLSENSILNISQNVLKNIILRKE